MRTGPDQLRSCKHVSSKVEDVHEHEIQYDDCECYSTCSDSTRFSILMV